MPWRQSHRNLATTMLLRFPVKGCAAVPILEKMQWRD